MEATIAVTCPACHQKMKVKAKLAGKRFRCPGCQEPVSVPDVPEAAQPTEPGATRSSGLAATSKGSPARVPNPQGEGYGLSEDAAAESAEQAAACPHCGATMEPGTVLCIECGYHTEKETVLKTTSARKLSPAHWLAIGGVAFVLLLLSLVFLWPSGEDNTRANKRQAAAARTKAKNPGASAASAAKDGEAAEDAADDSEANEDATDEEPLLPYAPDEPFRPEQALPGAEDVALLQTPAQEVAAEHLPKVSELWQRLGTSSRRPPDLLETAKWCAEEALWLESEECLRSILTAEPDNEEADRAYARLAEIGFRGAGAGTLEVPELSVEYGELPVPDGDLGMPVPRDSKFALIKIAVAPHKQDVRLDEESLRAFAGDEQVEFVGFLEKASGEIQDLARGREPPSKPDQLWEVMEVESQPADKSQKRLVRFRNTQGPVPPRDTPRSRSARSNELPPYRTRGDTSYFEAEYKGPYSLIVALPKQKNLTHLQYADEPKIGLLQEKKTEAELAALQFDAEGGLHERLVALRNLPLEKTASQPARQWEVLAQFDQMMQEPKLPGELYLAAREKVRRLRRRLNRIDSAYLPETDPARSLLTELTVEIEPQAEADRSRSRRTADDNGKLRVALRVDEPARYYCWVEALGPGPQLEPIGWAWVSLDIAEPGVYRWSTPLESPEETKTSARNRSDTTRDESTGESEETIAAQNFVFEIWNDRQLVDRRLIADSGRSLALLRRKAGLHNPYPLEQSGRVSLARDISRNVELIRCQSTTRPEEGAPVELESGDRRRRPGRRGGSTEQVKQTCPFPGCEDGAIGVQRGRNAEEEPIECPRCNGSGEIDVHVPLPPERD